MDQTFAGDEAYRNKGRPPTRWTPVLSKVDKTGLRQRQLEGIKEDLFSAVDEIG